MLTYAEAVQALYRLGNESRGIQLGLDRIRLVLEHLGNPHLAFRSIHVAGTNGKGSVCAMIESALRHTGLRTGLYTSPHLVDVRERVCVGGQPVSPEQFAWAFEQVSGAVAQLEAYTDFPVRLSFFETLTAMGFLLFRELGVEWAVVEVGLGGRLDATNVLRPELSVITLVDYDHEHQLGGSIEAIAWEKGGIIKPGVPVVIGRQRREASSVLIQLALAQNCPWVDCREWQLSRLRLERDESWFDLRGPHGKPILTDLHCPFRGEHQVDNTITAAAALWQLGLDPEAIRHGIALARWPGRLEVVRQSPLVLLDGAHNPAGMRALAAYLNRFFPGRRIWVAWGSMRDKALDEVAGILSNLATRLLLVPVDPQRGVSTAAALNHFFRDHRDVQTADSVADILGWIEQAEPTDVIVVTGSLRLVGEARALLTL